MSNQQAGNCVQEPEGDGQIPGQPVSRDNNKEEINFPVIDFEEKKTNIKQEQCNSKYRSIVYLYL